MVGNCCPRPNGTRTRTRGSSGASPAHADARSAVTSLHLVDTWGVDRGAASRADVGGAASPRSDHVRVGGTPSPAARTLSLIPRAVRRVCGDLLAALWMGRPRHGDLRAG